METKFNFKSAICTSREQGERLLALGLRKETADMSIEPDLESIYEAYYISAYPPSRRGIPAWSLHRLIEMALRDILICGISFTFNEYAYEKVIQIIEHQIKEGYFPKEYLV